ncbi:hypothetical protein Peur_031461 [Populus x canadensis]
MPMNESAESSIRVDGESPVYSLDEALTSVGLGNSNFSWKGLLGSTILTGGAGLFSNFSPNYVSLLILRCFVGVGIGVGGTTVFCPWFLEFAPVSNRGKRMVLLSTFWTVGTIFEAALAWIVMPRLGWRWLLALSSLPSIAMLLLYSLVPESPTYLCMKELSREQSKSGSSTVLRSENLQDDSLYVDVFILVWQVLHAPSPPPTLKVEYVFLKLYVVEIPGLILSAIIVDTIGRRLSISFMFASGCIFLSPLFYHQSATLTTTLMFGARMSSRVLSTLATIYAQEVSPGIHAFCFISNGREGNWCWGCKCCREGWWHDNPPCSGWTLVTGGHHTEAIILLDIVMAISALCVLLIPVKTKGHELSDSVDVSDSKQVAAAGH